MKYNFRLVNNELSYICVVLMIEEMKKRILSLLLFSAFIYSGCLPYRKDIVIGISQCSEDVWRTKLNLELETSSHYYDHVRLRFVSADDDSGRQIGQIEKFVEEKVDLLIVSPNQTHEITPAIEAAYDAGIPVILFDRKIDSDKYTAFIGGDNTEIGRIMGYYIADRLGGKGKVVEIQGLEGSSPASERHNGFVEALSSYPNIEIVGSGYGDWLSEGGQDVMASFLSQELAFNAVFAQNDRMAKGARNAMQDASGVLFFGIDALADSGLQDVLDGNLAASYIYPTRGDLVMDLAMDILSGRPYARENFLESALVDAHNARMVSMQEDEIAAQQEKILRISTKLDNFLAEYNMQKLVLWLIIAVTVLLSVTGVMFALSLFNTRRLNAELEHRNRELQDMSAKLEESITAKLNFFTSVSHDLRTPLTLVSGPLNQIIRGPLNEEQKQFLSIVRKNVDILTRLVGNILDFRKIESGSMKLKWSRFDLAEAVREWMSGFLDAADGMTFSYEGPSSCTVEADMHLMERVLFNLLSNAFKFTPHNGGGIIVRVRPEEDAGYVLVEVHDNGNGIAEDKLPFIFDQFYQADGAATGTGIGLSLVRSIAELHGGNVYVRSRLDEGSVFTVRIPLRHPDETVEISADSPSSYTEQYADSYTGDRPACQDVFEKLERTDDSQPTILVVDDNEDIRAYVRKLLGGDFCVLTAAGGEEGFRKAVREQPDLIISDVMMPVMDGMELCRRLKEELVTSHIPVILLTAKSLDEQRSEGYELGADAYISKPFSEKVLLSRINNLLKSRTRLKEHYLETGESISFEKENEFLDRLRAIITKNLTDPELSIEKIASEIGLGRVQLYRKVKSLTGYSPIEVIRIMRLKAAKRLLKSTDKTVSEIAYAVGFGTPSYFSKCYKEFFGRHPNEDRLTV